METDRTRSRDGFLVNVKTISDLEWTDFFNTNVREISIQDSKKPPIELRLTEKIASIAAKSIPMAAEAKARRLETLGPLEDLSIVSNARMKRQRPTKRW